MSDVPVHKVADTHECPSCRSKLTGATGPKAAPKPGDLTVCAYCEALLQFAPGGTMKMLKDADVRALSPEERRGLYAALDVVRMIRRMAAREQ